MNLDFRAIRGMYLFTFSDWEVLVEASHINAHRDGRTTAELMITQRNGTGNRYLNQTQLNLLASPSRKKFAHEMEERLEGLPWEEMIERVCFDTLRHYRLGEPVVEINTMEDIERPRFLVSPLLPENQPTIIYGLGSSGKSLFALVIGGLVMFPEERTALGLHVSRQANVLYLDWETDRSEIAWRSKCIQQGMGLPDMFFQYRRCTAPLADDLEQIERVVLEKSIGLLICDSLGPASGVELNGPEGAIRFFGALRQLGISSLILAHESKGPSADKGPYGSVYYLNLARSVWHVKKSQQVGKDEFLLLMKHVKVNSGKLQLPLAYKVSFGATAVKVERVDAKSIPVFADDLPLPERITASLLAHGTRSAIQLAEELGVTVELMGKTLTMLKDKGLVDNHIRGLWAVLKKK